MKVFSIFGVSDSGKTTTAEYIIRELRKRNNSVGSVKDIHFEEFAIDKEGTNTYRHKAAGAQLVTARGLKETDILFQRRLEIDEILAFYHYDYVVLEGYNKENCPKILTAHTVEELKLRWTDMVFAISGKVAEKITEFNGVPAINALTHIEKLVDLIEAKVFDLRFDEDLQPKHQTEAKDIFLSIGGKEIQLNAFVQDMLQNTAIGMIKSLKGYEENQEVIIRIKGKNDGA